MLKEGLRKEQKYIVSDSETAKAVGSGNLPVLATPILIAYMENVSMLLAAENIENNLTTVGGYIGVKHLRPTLVGKDVRVSTTIIDVDNKKVTFKIEAHDEDGLIGEGEHVRFVVDRDKFMNRLK